MYVCVYVGLHQREREENGPIAPLDETRNLYTSIMCYENKRKICGNMTCNLITKYPISKWEIKVLFTSFINEFHWNAARQSTVKEIRKNQKLLYRTQQKKRLMNLTNQMEPCKSRPKKKTSLLA